MDAVLVEFAVGKDRTEECRQAVAELTRSFVALQPAFHGATIHVEEETGTVWNLMHWDTYQDFIAFRDGNADRIGTAVGQYGPKGRMLTIADRVEKAG